MNRRRKSKNIVIVALEGLKVLSDSRGVAPLRRAMRDVFNPDDEILVLTLLYVGEEYETRSRDGHSRIHQRNQLSEEDSYIRFLQQEIRLRKDAYKRIFRPIYKTCKSIGVKLQVKIVAGFQPKDVIIEEANNAGATWIVIDSCFARNLSFRLNGTECNVSLVNDYDEAMFTNRVDVAEWTEDSGSPEKARLSKSPKLMKGSTATKEPGDLHDSLSGVTIESQPSTFQSKSANISNDSEVQSEFHLDEETETCTTVKLFKDGPRWHTISAQEQKIHSIFPTKANILLERPAELTWEVLMEITQGFEAKMCIGHNENCWSYCGFLRQDNYPVMVKRFQGDHISLLEAERKAALSLHHKNILRLLAYLRTEIETILVFPYVYELMRKKWELSFEERLKIAIGIAQGVRYMHEECPRGTVVHCQLHYSNIYLTSDLQPVISGFGSAKWIHHEQDSPSPATSKRRGREDTLVHGSMLQMKSDIFSFGILLLRLFCRRSVPQDDKTLVEWARQLLLQRAFHLLLDKESDDIHAVYRVMTAATLCTKTKPILRPCITEVISILKGEIFCNMQSSPSDSSA